MALPVADTLVAASASSQAFSHPSTTTRPNSSRPKCERLNVLNPTLSSLFGTVHAGWAREPAATNPTSRSDAAATTPRIRRFNSSSLGGDNGQSHPPKAPLPQRSRVQTRAEGARPGLHSHSAHNLGARNTRQRRSDGPPARMDHESERGTGRLAGPVDGPRGTVSGERPCSPLYLDLHPAKQ